jgi:hypothetical protein
MEDESMGSGEAVEAPQPADVVGGNAGGVDAGVRVHGVDAGHVRTLTLEQAHVGWTSFRQHTEIDSLEIFVSPHGKRYRRVKTAEEADLIAPMRSKGVGPMYLANIDHWVSGDE